MLQDKIVLQEGDPAAHRNTGARRFHPAAYCPAARGLTQDAPYSGFSECLIVRPAAAS
jgi:hypothetical protein